MSTALQEKQTQAIAIMPAARVAEVAKLAATAKEASKQILTAPDEHTKAFIMAHSIIAIKSALTDAIMRDVMTLANSPLGFKTDRPPGAKNKDGKELKPYPACVVRDVVVQALLRGLRMTGNEINIIAGNLYVTKEGCRRLVREFPGLRNLKLQCGVPKTQSGGALVEAKASWVCDGRPDSLVCEGAYAIPIKVNTAMGADAILGKAESKMYRRIYEQLVGSAVMLPDSDEPEAEPAQTLEDDDGPIGA